MDNFERISVARERQAKQKREKIINASMKIFKEKCLEDTSMEEVAKKAGVGSATVYRYFSTKIELVIETAEFYWEEVSKKYLKEIDHSSCESGYAQLKLIMDIFIRIFYEQKPFLKFLQEFDVFVKKYQISEERLADYESGILKLKPYMAASLERGRQDGSLSFDCSVDEMYFSIAHTMLALMEKLAVGGDILASDQVVPGERQLHITVELLLHGIKNGM